MNLFTFIFHPELQKNIPKFHYFWSKMKYFTDLDFPKIRGYVPIVEKMPNYIVDHCMVGLGSSRFNEWTAKILNITVWRWFPEKLPSILEEVGNASSKKSSYITPEIPNPSFFGGVRFTGVWPLVVWLTFILEIIFFGSHSKHLFQWHPRICRERIRKVGSPNPWWRCF